MPTLVLFTLFTHVALGTVAVIAGAIALGSRKGRKVHVSAGRVFVVSMGLTSLLGGVLAALRYETYWITFHAGILGATLVASGVLAILMRVLSAKRLFIAVGILNALNAAGLVASGWYATTLPDARLYGFAAGDYFFCSAWPRSPGSEMSACLWGNKFHTNIGSRSTFCACALASSLPPDPHSPGLGLRPFLQQCATRAFCHCRS